MKGLSSSIWQQTGLDRHVSATATRRPLLKKALNTTTTLLFLFVLIVAVFLSSSWINHDWILESQNGYKQSGLASQCTYRYKIYIEGWAWSVSEKYILACDSVTLFVKPHYYDFFTRSLEPLRHYWPIRSDDKCRSIKFAVDWGNNHKQEAQAIGKAASDFIQQELNMDYVYDYMFQLLNEYSKLLRFEPKVPEGAVEFCSETMACSAEGSEKRFMMESLVKGPSVSSPCSLPPPYEPQELGAFVKKKANAMKRVETWERKYWEGLDNKQQ